MTNQTVIFSVVGVNPTTNVAYATKFANDFIKDNMNTYTNFCTQPAVVTVDGAGAVWYAVQVNYYDPAVQEG